MSAYHFKPCTKASYGNILLVCTFRIWELLVLKRKGIKEISFLINNTPNHTYFHNKGLTLLFENIYGMNYSQIYHLENLLRIMNYLLFHAFTRLFSNVAFGKNCQDHELCTSPCFHPYMVVFKHSIWKNCPGSWAGHTWPCFHPYSCFM
jgi:hypothetical protein